MIVVIFRNMPLEVFGYLVTNWISMIYYYQALWYRLSLLLNRLPHENDILGASGVEITSRMSSILKATPNEDWKQLIALPEDLALQSLSIFQVIGVRLGRGVQLYPLLHTQYLRCAFNPTRTDGPCEDESMIMICTVQ